MPKNGDKVPGKNKPRNRKPPYARALRSSRYAESSGVRPSDSSDLSEPLQDPFGEQQRVKSEVPMAPANNSSKLRRLLQTEKKSAESSGVRPSGSSDASEPLQDPFEEQQWDKSLAEGIKQEKSAIIDELTKLTSKQQKKLARQKDAKQNHMDTSPRPSLNLMDAVLEDLDEPNPTEVIHLMSLDAEEDQVIRNMAAGDVDVLHFEWCSAHGHFEGVREEFTGPSGPTFDHSEMSPLQVFQQIWDTSILDHIVIETNNYARGLQSKRAEKRGSRMSRWKETTREEIWRFLTILMLQSMILNSVEREYWYPSNDFMRIGNFEKIMSYNRFLLIKRCLHFTDKASLPEHPSELDKIIPIITHLNHKFGTLYLPEQNVAIDESLLRWEGRLSFSQKIATRRAREGLKSFELCEARTGYLWQVEVYSGKRHNHDESADVVEDQEAEDEPKNATSPIVFNLMRPLFGKGHTLVMNNYYNSPLLSRLLKTQHQTDTMGTLRRNREFVPEELKAKTKDNMKSFEVCSSCTKDLCVIVYMDMDENIVPMISTFHKPEVGGHSRIKPKVITDYNLSMGGIDRKDQLLSSYPMERCKNLGWFKKLFRRLLNVSIHNASVIYHHGRTCAWNSTRPFRLQLIREMLEMYCDTSRTPQPPRPTLPQMHLPVKVNKSQRCKLCYKNKVRCTTVWSCGTCRVNLCIQGCYTNYHKELSQLDFTDQIEPFVFVNSFVTENDPLTHPDLDIALM